MIEPLALRDDPCELAAAVQLARTRHVLVRTSDPARARWLRARGFVEAPASLDCVIRLPFDGARLSRNVRKSVTRSLDAWRAAGLRLSVYDLATFGVDRAIDELYYPVFVRHFYSLGISPYGAHRLDQFVRIARPTSYVAVIERQGVIAAGALLAPSSLARAIRVVGGTVASAAPAQRADACERPGRECGRPGPWHDNAPNNAADAESTQPVIEGLVYALPPDLLACRRALMVGLAQAFGELGFGWLSLGRDQVWCSAQYAGVIAEKIRLADAVLARFDDQRHFYRWNPRLFSPGEGVLFAAWSGDGLSLCNPGAPIARRAELSERLAVAA